MGPRTKFWSNRTKSIVWEFHFFETSCIICTTVCPGSSDPAEKIFDIFASEYQGLYINPAEYDVYTIY